MYSVVQWLGDGAERDFKIVFAVLPVIGFALLAAGAVAGFGPTRRDVRAVRRCLGAAVFLLVPAASATAQEKEFADFVEDLARAARLSSSQVAMIEKIHQQAEPEAEEQADELLDDGRLVGLQVDDGDAVRHSCGAAGLRNRQ